MDTNIKLVIDKISIELDGKNVLKELSFDVKDGEILSILGPSGSGKTTLLRILIGLLKPNSGKIIKDGEDITNFLSSQRKMGMVFQDYALFENMTVLENIEYALISKKKNRNIENKKIIRSKAIELIELLGLKNHINKNVTKLSGGEAQRVAICRTLMLNPEIILWDEPMSALDASNRLILRQEIVNIQKIYKTTMIYVTHDQEEAFSISQRIMVMNAGKVIQIGSPKELINNYRNEFINEFVIKNLINKYSLLKNVVEDINK